MEFFDVVGKRLQAAQEKALAVGDQLRGHLEDAVSQVTPPIQIGEFQVQKGRVLAEGGFAKVYIARDANSERVFALKRVICQTKEAREDARTEWKMLKAFGSHPNVITLVAAAAMRLPDEGGRRGHTAVNFLFPVYERGTVFDAIAKAMGWSPAPDDGAAGDVAGGNGAASFGGLQNADDWPFTERECAQILMGVSEALLALHARGIAHRDIKPHNVLLADDGSPVLMDFGSCAKARKTVDDRKGALALEDDASVKCSAPYRAPELTEVNPPTSVDERVDVWSLGCTAYVLAFGDNPFESPVEGVKRLAILNGSFTMPAHGKHPLPRFRTTEYSKEYLDLIRMMLVVDLARRPYVPEVLEHVRALAQPGYTPRATPSGPANGAPAERAPPHRGERARPPTPPFDAYALPPAELPAAELPAAAAAAPAAEADILDFGGLGFGAPEQPPAMSTRLDSASSIGTFDADFDADFGAFSSAPAPAPVPAAGTFVPPPLPAPAAPFADDFGDFASATAPAPAPAAFAADPFGGGAAMPSPAPAAPAIDPFGGGAPVMAAVPAPAAMNGGPFDTMGAMGAALPTAGAAPIPPMMAAPPAGMPPPQHPGMAPMGMMPQQGMMPPQPGMPGMPGMQPGMMQPGMMQPGTMQPGMMQPGMMPRPPMQPGMPGMQPGMMPGAPMSNPFDAHLAANAPNPSVPPPAAAPQQPASSMPRGNSLHEMSSDFRL